MVRLLKNSELETIWKEVVLAESQYCLSIFLQGLRKITKFELNASRIQVKLYCQTALFVPLIVFGVTDLY